MPRKRPPTADVVPGMEPFPARMSLRGVMHIAYNERYQSFIARAWPRKPWTPTPARLANIAKFKIMVQGLKFVTGEQQQAARELSKKTPFTWRDLLEMASTGRLVFMTTSDGKLWMGWAMANETIQVLLDSIFNVPGGMLVRTPNGWQMLLPPSSAQFLSYDVPNAIPKWVDLSVDAQAILDQITTTPGQILINTAGTWVGVDGFTLYDAAGSAATALAAAEAYTDSKLASAGAPFHPGFITGRWYTVAETGTSSVFLNANEIYTCPFYVPNAHTFQGIGIHVGGAAAAGKLAALGVYANNNGAPAALEYDCGTVAVSTTGDKTITGLSLALSAGWHFLAVASDGNPTITALSNSGSFTASMLLGRANIGDVETAFANCAWTFSAGHMPNPFNTVAYGSSGAPLILLKA